MKRISLFVLFLVAYVNSSNVRVDPLVLISDQGLVRGQKATNGDYSLFLGLPYAQVDENDPFGPAQTPVPFHDVIFNANDNSVKCPQTSHSTSNDETIDCLRLNVYVPYPASSTNPLPVLVWIHGGDFAEGSAGDYGVSNIVRHGVVVVSINYRLGPYGFMCLDLPGLPGNQGLKDQYLALNWVRKNIASFGGNPYNVTISGQDAGATSVLLHLYSAKDKLFHKAIIESGTPQTEGLFVNGDADAALKIAEHLGFNTSDTEQALEFLISTPHSLVTAAAKELKLQLKPCKEKSFSGIENFVENDPFSLTNKRKINNTPILIGYTDKESDSLSEDYFKSNPFEEKLRNNFDLDEEQLQKAAKNIRHFYIGDKAISPEVASKLEDFESDFVYNHPSQRTITRLLEENASPIYEYLFSYIKDSAMGAGHSAELNYLFDISDEERTEEDQLIVDRITTLWANFVKFGNPTPQVTDLVPVTWSPLTEETRPYLVIDSDIRLESRVNQERMAYWDLFYSIYGKYSYLTRECYI